MFAIWSGLMFQIQSVLLRQQLGHLGREVGHEAHMQRLDRGLALGRARPVVVEALEDDLLALVVLDDLVGAGADRLGGEALGPDLLAIGLGMDRRHHGEIFQRRRRRPLHLDAHGPVAGLLGLVDPGIVRRRRHLARGIGRHVDGVDDVVGRERAAVVELHALADGEVERVVLGELPVGGERRLDLEGRGIAMHQHVPGLVRQDQPGALAVEVHVDVGHGVDELDAQACRRSSGRRRAAPPPRWRP